jgi:excinuclease ABC subunit A
MERRYRDTESSGVREELSKYVSTAPCHSCGGTRLCADARSVYVDGRTLPSITQLPVGEAHAYFEALEMEGRQGEIADKILKELRARYRFLVDVGLNYLSLNRSAETLSGGEAQRHPLSVANRCRVL